MRRTNQNRGYLALSVGDVFCYESKTDLCAIYKHMRYLAFLVLLASIAAASQARDVPARRTFNGPDRTITWKPWHHNPKWAYSVRTGDRYLGHRVWEHYLLIEGQRSPDKALKFSMIHLAQEDVLENVVICPELRCAIFKITNGNMTAHKGVWSWTARELEHAADKKVRQIAARSVCAET
jgi:hypothetical protein